MRQFEYYLFPILSIIVGIITMIGFDIFGAAAFESAPWKQNVILTLLIIYIMLPQSVKEMRISWMGIGFLIAFFMNEGEIGEGKEYFDYKYSDTVVFALKYGKIFMAALILFMGYRLWYTTWRVNKFYMILPVLALISVTFLFPIKYENLLTSGLEAIKNLSLDRWKSDMGFHLYLGAIGILAGITEIIIQTKAPVESEETLRTTQNM